MFSAFNRLQKSLLFRGVVVMASGTALAQAILLLFMPIITRLYGPENLGLQGIFTSIVVIAATVSALAYPMATVLPKAESDARTLAILSIYISIATTLLLAIFLFFWGDTLLQMVGAAKLTDSCWLIPIAVFFHTLNTTTSYWLVRHQAYRINAASTATTALLVNATKATLGWAYPSSIALVLTTSIGYLFNSIIGYLGYQLLHRNHTQVDTPKSFKQHISSIPSLAKQHSDFPLLRMPQNLINAISLALPALLLASLFDASSAGQYSIASAVLIAPVSLIGNAVSSVFYPRTAEAVRSGETVRPIIIRGTYAMCLTGFLPYLAVFIYGPPLFSLVFGSEWMRAGEYAQALTPLLFLQYIARPSIAAAPPLRLQGGLLLYEIFSTGAKLASLWVGFYYFESDSWAIWLFSCTGALAYAWLIYWTISKAGPPDPRSPTPNVEPPKA